VINSVKPATEVGDMPAQTCPKCKSTNIRPSRSRGLKEKFLKKLGWELLVCREKECHWRWLFKPKSTWGLFKDFVNFHKVGIMATVFIIGLLFLGAAFIVFCISSC
jgi:hypothetical protein